MIQSNVPMENLVSVSQLRQNAARVLKQVTAEGEPCIVVSRSNPVAVILNPRTYETMRKRIIELERAELARDVEEGMRELKAGKAKVLRSLRDLR